LPLNTEYGRNKYLLPEAENEQDTTTNQHSHSCFNHCFIDTVLSASLSGADFLSRKSIFPFALMRLALFF
jgi:hypothetical protein